MNDFCGQIDQLDRAGVVALLAAADEPAKALQLIVTALEKALAEARSVASGRLADRQAWRKKMADASSRRTDWTEKAERAISAGRTDLAEGALLEKKRAFDESAFLADGAILIDQIVRDSEEEIAKLQILLRDVKSRVVPIRRRLFCR